MDWELQGGRENCLVYNLKVLKEMVCSIWILDWENGSTVRGKSRVEDLHLEELRN